MLYILSGPDDFSLAQTLSEIKKSLGPPDVLATNTAVLEGQVSPDHLRVMAETVPFLAEKRLIIVKGLLERFEPKTGASRPKKTAKTNQQDELKAFTASLTRIPESTVMVLVEGKISASNPLFKEISGKATVKTFPLLRDELRLWIRDRVKKEGGSISPQAVDLLARLVGSDLWAMSGEICKLVLYANGRAIDETDVRKLVSYAQTSIFELVDAIFESRVEAAQQLLERLLQDGTAPTYILVMLARQARLIVLAKDLAARKKPRAEIQTRLGLTNDFALGKTLEQTRHYSLSRVKEVYEQLLAADLAIKTGMYDGELALNILVAELGRRGKMVAQSSP